MKAWRQVAITEEKRMEKARARKEKGDWARINRAIRLIRRGAISRAGKNPREQRIGEPNIRQDMGADSDEVSKAETKDTGGGVDFCT